MLTNEMTLNAYSSTLGSEFDDFLFAPVVEDGSGMLSVLSVLARRDLDPWQEAASLAGLPAATAAQRLASLIGELPDRLLKQLDPGAIATRLVALLPRRTNSTTPAPTTRVGTGVTTNSRAVLYAICLAIFVILMLYAQFGTASR